jgi:Ca2+-binding EF-hand superfamily protein
LDKVELGMLSRRLAEGSADHHELAADELDEVMAAMDRDGDGSVTFDEFWEWWQANKDAPGLFGRMTSYFGRRKAVREAEQAAKEGAALQEARSEALAIFQEMDADDSGDLDKVELGMLSRRLAEGSADHHELAADELDEVMAAIGRESDGSVTFDEFWEWWQANKDAKSGFFSHMFGTRSTKVVVAQP